MFDESKATVIDKNGQLKLIAKRRDNLYFIEGEPPDSCRQVVSESDKQTAFSSSTDIWHQRMAHLNLHDMDLCGPMRVVLNVGSRYFITFTDDQSRWTEVRFIKNKHQALEEFKSYKTFVEKQHGVKIKAIQPDNGKEFVNREFNDFLKSVGIQR